MSDDRIRGAPIFVKIDDYKDILDIISLIKVKISEAKKTLDKINQLKNDEDEEISSWEESIRDVEKKIDYVDKTLFEPDSF